MDLPSTPILRFTTRHPVITLRALRSPLGSGSPSVRTTTAVGVTTAGGDTATSTLISTTTTYATTTTRISIAGTSTRAISTGPAPCLPVAATTGNTIRNIVVELRIQTGQLRPNMAARLVGIPRLRGKPMPGRTKPGNSPPQ